MVLVAHRVGQRFRHDGSNAPDQLGFSCTGLDFGELHLHCTGPCPVGMRGVQVGNLDRPGASGAAWRWLPVMLVALG